MSGSKSDEVDWFYYVNGVQAAKGAASTQLHKGDHIWWDRHDYSATDSIPAVVGSFPEPFTNGVGGQRYPTIVECVNGKSTPCQTVTNELSSFKIPVSQGGVGYGSGNDSIGVVVGPWKQIDGELAAELVKFGPGASGVYARFVDDGSKLELLGANGKVAKTFGPDTGLVAAVNGNGGGNSNAVPSWLITGTDAAGVAAAAKALTPSTLADRVRAGRSRRHRLPGALPRIVVIYRRRASPLHAASAAAASGWCAALAAATWSSRTR